MKNINYHKYNKHKNIELVIKYVMQPTDWPLIVPPLVFMLLKFVFFIPLPPSTLLLRV